MRVEGNGNAKRMRVAGAPLMRVREVGPTGVEPARPCGHKALNLARLPIPPRARKRKFTPVNAANQGTEEVPISAEFGDSFSRGIAAAI